MNVFKRYNNVIFFMKNEKEMVHIKNEETSEIKYIHQSVLMQLMSYSSFKGN